MSVWDCYFESPKINYNNVNYNTEKNHIQSLQKGYEEDDQDYLTLFASGELSEIGIYLQGKKRMSSLITRRTNHKLPPTVKSHKQFISYVTRANLFSDVFINLSECKEKEYFPCILFKHHFAWIDKDQQEGIYRYFTMEKGGLCRSFSVLDLVSVANPDLTSIELVRVGLLELLGCEYEEYAWAVEQKARQKKNQATIQNSGKEWKNHFPALYKLTKSYMNVLYEMMKNEAIHPLLMKHSYKKMHAVYISTRHLNQLIGTDASTISKAINLFSSIGLIHKIPPHDKDFPLELLNIGMNIRASTIEKLELQKLNSKTINKKEGEINCRLITFYAFPLYTDELLTKVEENAKKLLMAKVTNIKKINEKNIANALGKDIAKTIFFEHKEIMKEVSKRVDRSNLQKEIVDTDGQVMLDEEIPF
ncbi:hypothetical protein [Bacillus sp. ISL-55]|uniref:hypothetical protein n=1 Tax=Bacillus sp. ISL-55 TaxID=2819134 RepID=UPI001BE92272|nr:hypothetical protein [Bacillus sp. ISL-55]MBT2694625.1 hypothetical protein [Bacillus sp. ISL-55]